MSGLEIAEAYLDSLLKSERASPAELAAYQARLLRRLVKHACGETPFYEARPQPPEDLTAESPYWLAQPCIGRSDLTGNFDAFRPRSFSKLHGTIMPISTGGSTGRAARRDLTSLESVGRLLASYRMFHNWGLDQARPLFVLRKPREGEAALAKWGFPWREEAIRGDRRWIGIGLPAGEQLAAMAGLGPVYVNTLPSNILRLSHEALRTGTKLSIPFIICVGEYLSPEVRAAAKRAFGSTVIDFVFIRRRRRDGHPMPGKRALPYPERAAGFRDHERGGRALPGGRNRRGGGNPALQLRDAASALSQRRLRGGGAGLRLRTGAPHHLPHCRAARTHVRAPW